MRKKTESLISWYRQRSRGTKAGIRAFPVAAVTYCSALLAGVVAETLKLDGLLTFLFVTVMIVAFLIVLMLGLELLMAAVAEIEEKGANQQKVLGNAHSQADGWMLEEIKDLTAMKADGKQPKLLAPSNPMRAIDGLVSSVYTVLSAHYGQAERLEDRIDFEVTYMTKSFADDEITIGAWANRDGRKPTSMNERRSNPRVYEQTVTAAVYRSQQPSMRIIEDTSDPKSNYEELYSGQKERIRSSVVSPVFSADFELLGTLVLHCDRQRFFKVEDRKFWHEFCEVFAKRIALEALLLNLAAPVQDAQQLGAQHWDEPPY
ncbi:MAG TPA: hypothetical protein VIT89_02155 [Solirubrobacterales bacterium]